MSESDNSSLRGTYEPLCTARIDDQGRIVLPPDVREAWQLEPGDLLLFASATTESCLGITLYRPGPLRDYLKQLSHSIEEHT